MTWSDILLSAALLVSFLGWLLQRLAVTADGTAERRRHLSELDRRTTGQRDLSLIGD